jgi:type IV pilus assembly protein PilV
MLNGHIQSFPLRTLALQGGTSLIEVLVTLLVVALGLLGVAGLQAKISLAEMESYQRSQAILALTEMIERIDSNRTQAKTYVTSGTIGTGDSWPADCTGIAIGPNRDICEWSNKLKGASETKSASNVGGMVGALGCITQLQAANPATAVCQAGIYQVSVAWQGNNPTVAPALACGLGSFGANDAYRRVVASTISVSTASCQL